jgi:hypothetical protein
MKIKTVFMLLLLPFIMLSKGSNLSAQTENMGQIFSIWSMGAMGLSKNQQLSNEIKRFGDYEIADLVYVSTAEIRHGQWKRFGWSQYFTIATSTTQKGDFYSQYDRYGTGLRIRYEMVQSKPIVLYTFADAGYGYVRHRFSDYSLDNNVFTTDNIFNFSVKGTGVNPTVSLFNHALEINAGIGCDFRLINDFGISLKATLLSTPSFPAYKYFDGHRITNLKRYHNAGVMFTVGIGRWT